MAFDTELEKSIGIGLEWPFGPLKMDECVISKNLQLRLDLSLGSSIMVSSESMENRLSQIIDNYNEVASENGWQRASHYGANQTLFSCTIAGVMTDTYGKFAQNLPNTIVFEYEFFVRQSLNYMIGLMPNLDFKGWLDSKPNLMYEYAGYALMVLPEPR